MTTKKLTALLLSVLMILQMFAVSAAAAYIEQAADPADIQYTIPRAETSWMADGIISDGEYSQIQIKPQDLSIAAASDEVAATAIRNPISLYMAYDDKYVYVAATTPADQYVCEIDETNEGMMWAAHSIELSFADIKATASAERVDLGYALSSLDHKLYAVSWFDPMGIAYDPDDNHDYTVVKNGNTLTYEMRVPFEAFVEKGLSAGDSFLGSVVWCVGTSEDGGADAYTHIQLGYGVSGDPGKDPTGHATFTLEGVPGESGSNTPGGSDTPDDPDNPVTPDEPISGTCGENVTWTLDANGLLTISGTGKMSDYGTVITDQYVDLGDAPWYGKAVDSVIIESGVTSIGNKAFFGCNDLADITVPNSVTSIGKNAFSWCRKLKSITIPNSVTSIGEEAFSNCILLTDITIPEGVTHIGQGAFSYCYTSANINVDPANQHYQSTDGVLFTKDGKKLLAYPGGKMGGYDIPESVTSIGDWAFLGCGNLTNIIIPDSVMSIGQGAFEECDSLTNITIPDGVTSIDFFVFGHCSSLASITIPDSVTSIEGYAFVNCSSLTNITIPARVISIDELAFNGCSSLHNIIFEGNAPEFGSSVFDSTASDFTIYYYEGTTGWTTPKWTDPDGIEYNTIMLAPGETPAIRGICGDNLTWTLDDNGVLTISGTGNMYSASQIDNIWNPETITKLVISEGVTTIGRNAFEDCTNLTAVSLPESLESIGFRAFCGCTKLTSVYIPDSVSAIDNCAFIVVNGEV